MKKILVNHNFTPDKEWIGDDYLIYDRSDDGIDHLKEFDPAKIIKTENVGQVDYDKLYYLVDNYDMLPDVFLWGKTNLFKYISKEEYEKVKDNQFFTPLLTADHKQTRDNLGLVNYYSQGIYHERNNTPDYPSWYAMELPTRSFRSFHEFAFEFGILCPVYIPFAPGGSYILTREVVHKYSRDFYQKMADCLPYCTNPAEAQMCERCYYLIWH